MRTCSLDGRVTHAIACNMPCHCYNLMPRLSISNGVAVHSASNVALPAVPLLIASRIKLASAPLGAFVTSSIRSASRPGCSVIRTVTTMLPLERTSFAISSPFPQPVYIGDGRIIGPGDCRAFGNQCHAQGVTQQYRAATSRDHGGETPQARPSSFYCGENFRKPRLELLFRWLQAARAQLSIEFFDIVTIGIQDFKQASHTDLGSADETRQNFSILDHIEIKRIHPNVEHG